jgi:1-acyl-sn-glycerol-3-phosphate acyltransferase
MDDKSLKVFENDYYKSEKGKFPYKPGKLSLFKTICFYVGMFEVVFEARKGILKGKYDFNDMINTSKRVFNYIEKTGAIIDIKGLDNLKNEEGTLVIVGNHMSTLETFVFPFLVGSVKECSFVVKKSLVTNRIFGPVMGFLKSIAVERKDPRKDLDVVMKEGTELLKNGTSVVLFPQSTRTPRFEPESFNSLGIKLAKRGGVKIIPCAVKSDFWETGKYISSLGHLYPERTVYFEFGKAVEIEGAGKKEHREIVDFIQTKIDSWEK